MDVLLEVGNNPQARKIIQSLGLPIPVPERLARGKGSWEALPLADKNVVFGAAPGADRATSSVIAQAITSAGANPYHVDGADVADVLREAGEAFGRLPRALTALADNKKIDALVFDATQIRTIEGLRAVYEFFHPLVRRLAKSGRVVVIGRSPGDDKTNDPVAAAAQAALEGFVRSTAKEIGRNGSTANLIRVEPGAEALLVGPLRFFLSRRSAFVTTQPIVVRGASAKSEIPYVRSLEKKVALVTGAARGIGAATARALAAEGAKVLCLDRPDDDSATSQLARDIGGVAVSADVTSSEAVSQIQAAAAAAGGLDVIVHNAGVTRDKTLARMSESQWDMVLDINLGAIARITAGLEKTLRDDGRIVILSSVAGIAGNVGQTNYAASKAGVIGFVQAEAARLAARRITVNAIAPGFIETRMTAAIPFAIREGGRRLSALGQGGLPEDVAAAITFFATPGSAGVSGEVLRVCGGALIGA